MDKYAEMSSGVKAWEEHFKKMVSGKIVPNNNGVFLVEKTITSTEKENEQTPTYKMVTPVA